jgi:hypothetical protein
MKAIRIKNRIKKEIQVIVLEKILVIAENKIIMKALPFFYE